MYNTRKVFHTTWRLRYKHSRCLHAACSILISLAFSLIVANGAQAATYYLDALNGDDSNPGTTDQPWKTLTRAYASYSGGGSKVQEGDTVYFRNGDYGSFVESGLSEHRTDWITYAADSGHSPSLASILVTWNNYKNSYLRWNGFNIKNKVSFQRASYFYVYDCNITCLAAEVNGVEVEGYYAPYSSTTAIAIAGRYDVNYVTIENCEISYCYRGMRCGDDGGEYWTIKNNTFHRTAEDSIRPDGASHLLIEGNMFYDAHKGRTSFGMTGTILGTFEVGETIIQAGTNAEGVVNTVGETKLGVYTTTEALFKDEGSSGGTVTGQSSGATLSNVTKCDYSHSDPIQIQSGAVVDDIVFRGNTLTASYGNSGMAYLRFYGRATNVTIENNLCYSDSANAFEIGGVTSGLKIYNNTFGTGLSLSFGYASSGSKLPSVIDELYNNIILSYGQSADVNESLYTRVVSHGNNIFGEVSAGGPTYPFALNGTEAVAGNLNVLFTNAAGNDYTLAAGSAAIDFGNADYGPSSDILGNSRVSAPDAGCYEYTGSESENNAPVLQSIGAKSASENTLLTFTISATDTDSDTITYSASNLPTGATFSSPTFSWTPGYTQTGSYNVTFTASDGADTDSEVVTITVSNTNRAPVLASIDAKSASENTLLSFTVSATDADSDTITYSASNLPTGATFSNSTFSWTPGYTRAGAYNVTFAASDGTDTDSEIVTITVANVNRPPVLASIGAKSVNEGASLAFSISATDADSDAITYSASNLPTGATFSSGSFNWTPGFARAGSYNITLTATDGTDTDSEIITVTVRNVNRTPVLAAIGGKSIDEGSLLSFSLAAADADGDPITYSTSNLPTGATLSGGSFSWTPGYTQAGSYNVTFTASDAAKSDSEIVTITVANTNRAPVLASIGAKSVGENASLTFTISATDADGDSITYSASNLPTGATFSSGSFSWTPGYTQAGSYNVTLTASDGTDSDSEVVTVTIANTNRAPVLASVGAKSVDENASLAFAISATDADGDSITYSASNLPPGATLSSGSFSWTPAYTQAGSYNVTFTASDGTDSDSEIVTITANNVNRAPVLASIGDKSVDENVLLGFTASATDADGDTITYTASDLPTGATFSNGSFSWTPQYEQAGLHNITFTASDGTDTHSETITINVGSVNRPPVLEAIGRKSIDESSLLSFSLNATDADGDSITYSAATLPTGSAFASQTFTWTPGYAQAGTHEVTFTASDGTDEDSETVTITVNNTNRAPVLDAIADQAVNEAVLLSFAVSATDADDDTLEYSATSLPSGASFTEQTFSWTPSHSQADNSYEITFTVSDGDLDDSQAVTITVSDTSAPSVTNRSPAADSIQAPLNNLVTLHVIDDGEGVDPATVTITLDGSVIYTGNTSNYLSATGNCRRTGAAADYTYAYQANEAFDFDETKTVTVNATDLGGNAMTEASYSFRTEMRSLGGNTLLGSDIENLEKAAPATAADGSGNIWAVWHAGPTGSRDIYLARLAAGATSFGASTQITTNSADQHNPAIAVGTDDKLYVVWQDNRLGDWDIYGSTSTNGTTFSAQQRISDSNDNQINPAIDIDSQSTNRAYVVWQDDRSGNQDIYIAVSANAFLTNAVTQITSNTSDQTTPAIAVDSSNTAHVVWTDARGATTDIYGASAGAWTNVAIVNNSAIQSNPAIAVESTGSILHFAWTDRTAGDSDIYYACSEGLPSSPLTGTNLIDDTSEADQISPAIAVAGSSGDNLHVFASWQDNRSTDTDLYMVQANAANRTNVLVGDGRSNSAQSEPAIGLDQYNQPYLVWTDGRNANNEIYYAASTFMQPTALTSQVVTTASGGTVGTDPNAITAADDVSVVVPAGASAYDVTISITKIENPPAFAVRRLSSYDFGPSGIEFSQPVTVTIAYAVSASDAKPEAYWYDSLTGALSQQGITDVETIVLSPTLHAMQFKTTHFTAFYVAAAAAGIAGGGGGGGGGGCSMSPVGQGNMLEFLVPYIALAAMMVILKRRDAKNCKASNVAKGNR